MTTPLPQHPANATITANNMRWTVRLQRTFPQDRDAVWTAITEPDHVAQWTPFRPNHNLGSAGPVRLRQIDGGDETLDSQVRDVVYPESLSYQWGSDLLRFGLADASGVASAVASAVANKGTMLTLAQTFSDRNMAASYAAGWHICLGALELLLDGKDVPSVVGMKAMEYGWKDLEQQYRALFQEQLNTIRPPDRTEEESYE